MNFNLSKIIISILFIIGFFCALKVEIKLPKKPLPLVRALLGCVIGSNFTNEIFVNINQIGKSLFILPFFIVLMILSTYFVLKIIMNYDKKTSLIGSMPGGLNEMVLLQFVPRAVYHVLCTTRCVPRAVQHLTDIFTTPVILFLRKEIGVIFYNNFTFICMLSCLYN